MIKFITSRDNKIIKQIISLHKKNGRMKTSLFVAEGKRICSEALTWASEKVEFFVLSESYYKEHNPDYANEIYVLPDDLFNKICDTETPQGILCVLKYNLKAPSSPSSDNVLIIDGVTEPGNMGTILRTAEAMGFYDVFITKGSVDIYSPKVIRSTMGAIFRLNFHFEESYTFIKQLKDDGYKIITTALRNSIDLEETNVYSKNAIVIGNEANGVSNEVLSNSDVITKIEMAGNAESLNAAVAAGIVMYKFSKRGE